MSKRRKRIRSKEIKRVNLFERIIRLKWSPILLFLSLTLLYFVTFLTSDVAILGSDHSPRGFFHKKSIDDLSRYIHPDNWSRKLGGTAVSDRRVGDAFFPLIVLRYLMPFYKSLGWWYIIITFCAGFFIFLYLGSLNVRMYVATLIGVCYMFAPIFLSLTFGGHYAKMEVVALTPLLFLTIEKGMETRKSIYFLFLSGVVALEILTNHLQFAYFSFWGAGFYFLFKLWQTFRRERSLKELLKRSAFFALAISLGLAIGAMNLFPPYIHTTTVSKRAGGVTYEYAASWALHPEEIGSLVVPEFGNHLQYYWGRNYFKLNSEYMGIVVFLIAFVSLFIAKKDLYIWFFLFLFLFAICYSLGSHTPLHRLFYLYMPGVKSLRGPGMIAFLFLFATCAIAALGLERLLSVKGRKDTLRITKILLATGIIGILAVLIISASLRSFFNFWTSVVYPDIPSQKREVMVANFPNVQKGLYLFCFFLISTLGLIYLRLKNRISDLYFALLIIPLILIDTWRIDKQFLNYANPRPFQNEKAAEDRLAAFLRRDDSDFRVLALVDDSKFRLEGLSMVARFDDFTDKRYYEITQPQNLISFNIINLLNAKYLVSKKRLQVPNLEEVYNRYGFFAYRNPQAYPYFYLASDFIVENDRQKIIELLKNPSTDYRRAVILEKKPEIKFDSSSFEVGEEDSVKKLEYNEKRGYIKLKVSCKGQRFLVVSENYHPNWRAFVDGKERKIYRADYVWKGVFLEPGEYIVEFRYFSKVALTCRWVSFLSFLVFLGAMVLIGVKKKTSSRME